MALSSTTKGFLPRRSLISAAAPVLVEFEIGNSKTITIGDAITLSAGYAQADAGGDSLAGVCVGIVDAKGINVFERGADVDGTLTGDDTYASASDNTTDKKCKVQLIVDPMYLFENVADSSLTAAEVGLFADINSTGDQITGTCGATQAQMQLVELVTTDLSGAASTTRGLFRIVETLFSTGLAA
mgnify:CR=1 FL=1